MPNAKRIETTAGPDREVGSIRRVAETNALIKMAKLDLTGSERRLMEFIIGNGGTYAGNQWAVTTTLKMTRRTLSRAQRTLSQRGLLDLQYNGRLTRYKIRPEGVQMALKSASSKGCAIRGASIESIRKDKTKESRASDSPSATPTSRPAPPEVPQAELPAAHPDHCRGSLHSAYRPPAQSTIT